MRLAQKQASRTRKEESMTENLAEKNHPLTVTNGLVNMPAVMEGLAQMQDGMRKMVMAGAKMQVRSLSSGYCLVIMSVHDHKMQVMDGEEEGTFALGVDGRLAREGWTE